MKVLFVGDGRHDIGAAEFGSPGARLASGVVFELARRVVPSISDKSPAIAWQELERFGTNRGKRGYEFKIRAAAMLAPRFDCAGLVCVADGDGDAEERREAMKRGAEGQELPIAMGVAVESIEAWTLGAPQAIAAELDLDERKVRAELPRKHVEELHQKSGKDEHRPKSLFRRICALAHREDCVDLRQAIAERTDPSALADACPRGFAPFVEDLRRAFAQ